MHHSHRGLKGVKMAKIDKYHAISNGTTAILKVGKHLLYGFIKMSQFISKQRQLEGRRQRIETKRTKLQALDGPGPGKPKKLKTHSIYRSML